MASDSSFFECIICMNCYNLTNRIPHLFVKCQHVACSACLPKLIKDEAIEIEEKNKNVFKKFTESSYEEYEDFTEIENKTISGVKSRKYIECPTCREVYYIKRRLEVEIPKHILLVKLIEDQEEKKSKKIVQSDPPKQILQSNPPKQWSQDDYLRAVFDSVDQDNNGTLSLEELHEALKNGQESNQFDIKTVELLIDKTDKNSNKQIEFNEFQSLFNCLNDLYLKFILIDTDSNGYIDSNEFYTALTDIGCDFSRKFFNYIEKVIKKRTHYNGITFDYFVRVIFRLEYWCSKYTARENCTIEEFILKNLFENFW